MRRATAIALLGFQLLAGAHLALAEHVSGDGGAIVDALPACELSGHSAPGLAHGHALEDADDCAVVAVVRAAVSIEVAETVAPPRNGDPAAVPPHCSISRQLSVLHVAPKGSPPG